MKLSASILTIALLGTAPFQCAHDPDASEHAHDTPSEALWTLSEQFKANGENQARTETLRMIVDRYPTSREADQAREALGQTGGSTTPPASTSASTPTTTSGTPPTTP
ncbi:MAG: hypothetical protein U0230_08110 [Polyangiales bacterium]